MNESLNNGLDGVKSRLSDWTSNLSRDGFNWRPVAIALGVIALALILLGWYWSQTPDKFDVKKIARSMASQTSEQLVVGSVTTAATIHLMQTLLEKPGGYLSNDVMPPSVWLDNMPNWEFGVLVQIRDITRSMRNDFSRSQSQSVEDKDLIIAEPRFNFDNNSWIIPSTEGEYRKGLKALRHYLERLQNPNQPQAQFYARADNLSDWLGQVEKRLGSLSQRLSASVGQTRINTDLAGESGAAQSTATAPEMKVKTDWTHLDDIFYEARGASWALLHLLKAVEVDFDGILRKKNALVSLRQIIRELESTQQPVRSPFIMNGSGFGMFANHSLVMASYISRANAALIDLRQLLQQG